MQREQYVKIKRKVVLACICLQMSLSFVFFVTYHYSFILCYGLSMYKSLGSIAFGIVRKIHWNSPNDLNSIHVGDIVDLRAVENNRILYYMKRVTTISHDKSKVWVRGEHPLAYDSRFYGWVSIFNIHGKLVWFVTLKKPTQNELNEIEKLEKDVKNVEFPYPDYPYEMPD